MPTTQPFSSRSALNQEKTLIIGDPPGYVLDTQKMKSKRQALQIQEPSHLVSQIHTYAFSLEFHYFQL